MAKLSISKAAKEWKISRTTIQEAVKSGDLKVESGSRNAKNVDTADLLRVFGEPKSTESTDKSALTIGQCSTDSSESQVNMTDKLISHLEAENTSLKENTVFLQDLIHSHLRKISELEEELAEYRKPVKRLGWFGRN